MYSGLVRYLFFHLSRRLQMSDPTQRMKDKTPAGGKEPLRSHRHRVRVQMLLGDGE